MRVRVVYFDGCPNAAPAEAFVQEVANEIGIEVTMELVRVTSADEAQREHMHGSPTVLINGLDVDPAQRSNKTYSFGCRVFGGANGLPPREMVVAALRDAEEAP